MIAEIGVRDDELFVQDSARLLAGKHFGQLSFWLFKYDAETKTFVARPDHLLVTLEKLVAYLTREGIAFRVSDEVSNLRSRVSEARAALNAAVESGAAIKNGDISSVDARPFLEFITTKIVRPLKTHQVKASLHLLAVKNGANFSVPGSGKTSVVLSVFGYLQGLAEVDALFVVGPPSCFGPWREEYKSVFGIDPRTVILAGGEAEERWRTYSSIAPERAHLYLTSYQTLQRDFESVQRWFKRGEQRFYLVVDEAHYIKQPDGIWASAVLSISPLARFRCVLTGTPFPRVYSDAFNLFDALWPQSAPLSTEDRTRLEVYSQKKQSAEATAILDRTIGPLFYRVRKSELGLAPQIFHPPICVTMNRYERVAYDAIIARVKNASRQDPLYDIDLVLRLRRGRMIRLRQSVSYAKLLSSAISEYHENLLEEEMSLTQVLTRYDDLERPAKLETLDSLVRELRSKGQKIVIWSNFIKTLHLICDMLKGEGAQVQLIYGETPTERASLSDELTREKIIADFTSTDGVTDILVANPAACAESISLHKSCANAVYYDLSYNCAQYLQSLDRIHRVGGSEERPANYYFLQYEDTIDDDILANLRSKADRMSAVIDREYPIYSLDMFAADEELEAYERLFA